MGLAMKSLDHRPLRNAGFPPNWPSGLSYWFKRVAREQGGATHVVGILLEEPPISSLAMVAPSVSRVPSEVV